MLGDAWQRGEVGKVTFVEFARRVVQLSLPLGFVTKSSGGPTPFGVCSHCVLLFKNVIKCV